MKIEDFIHRRHHQHQYQHLTANLSASSDAASAIVLSNLSSSTSFPSSPSSSSLSLSGTKRSSSLSSSGSFLSAINAPSSRKNHKNDETIFSTKMSNENNSIINAATTPIKNGLNGSSQTAPIISTSLSSSSSSSSSLAASAAFNNNNSCATSSSSSSLLSSSSIIASSSLSSSGTNIVAAVTDSRVQVSRANPIHSNSSSSNQHQQQQLNHYHHHNTTNNNNGTTISASGATATTTTAAAAMAISTRHGNSAITRIKNEPVENNGLDYSTFNNNKGGGGSGGGGGGMDGEVVGRIQTNSSAAAAGTSSDSSSSRSGLGGRLQFFKDGKFILELARAKEGEKSGWISVPRKQFRSPSTTSSTITPTYPKNESSTSLSFSDDNSSIQSSPWQRDHCWKQSTPRRGISKEMSFYFKRTHQQSIVSVEGFKSARIKRRRPLDNSVCKTPFRLAKNGSSIAAEIAVDDSKKVKIENDEKKLVDRENEDDDQNIAMDEEKSSSDDSSTEKEDSVRDSSKTPTPESQSCSSDTVDGASCSPKIAANSESIAIQKNPTTTTKEKENKRIMNGEKRLKSRAKLSTIIQKLLDRLPTGLYHLSKTQIIGGTVSQHSHHQTHSSHQMPSTSSRLASELHYHQQHVSPRKRILREFEKVSLEDSPVVISKRSRAKGNVPASVPLTPIPTGRGVAVPSSNTNTHFIANGNRNEQPTAAAATTVVSSANSILSNNTTPTRLYSSYSIHSLLSGSSNSNSSNNNRLKMEHPVNHLNQGSSGGGGYNDPSYLRAMLASPKSPEGCTPNSKSSPYSSSSTTSGSAKKRSPPYSPLSEIHHQHQHPHHHTQYHSRNRSPNVIDYGNMRSPPEAHSNRSYGNHTPSSSSSSRLTPPHGYLTSPKNSGALASNSEGYKNSSPNHHFYSPYMMSPKYVPPPSAMSPNSETYHPKLKGARSPSQQQSLRGGIFRTHSPHASTNQTTRESSPHRMLPSPSPGGPGGNGSGGGMSTSVTTTSTTTPRTVPKKTVSIRRQFASPSSSSPSPGLSEHLKNATANNNNNSSSSKVDERTQAMSPITDPRRTPTHDSSAAAAAVAVSKYHQQAAAAAAMMQRSSPLGVSGGGGGGAAAASSLYYNMYPPPNGSPSPHHSSSSPSPSPSSSYIPQLNPYYHPYVSTLAALRNPLWMHHYPAAAAAAAAAAGAAAVMMPSASAAGREGVSQMPGVPGVPFFPYNGAAAAAAAAAGSHSAHQMHHSSYAPMHLAAASQLGLQAPPPPPASMNRSPPTTTDDRISTSSIKEEHSSDVPLNLSKH